MPIEYGLNVQIGFPGGIERAAALAIDDARKLFPNVQRAIDELAEAAYGRWRAYASGEPLPSGDTIRPWTGQYLDSIQAEQVPGGWSIFSGDPKAKVIEEGAPAWDMRDVLATSEKVRRSEKGSLYLIIPFRHGTPDTIVVGRYSGREMPSDVYEVMRRKAQTHIVGQRQEPAVHYPDRMVNRNIYDWGDKLTLAELEALGYDPNEAATQRMAGMYRMSANTPTATSSTYVTFRTLSENSPEGTWIVPQRKGKYPAKAVFDWLSDSHDEIMEFALELDADHIRRLASA